MSSVLRNSVGTRPPFAVKRGNPRFSFIADAQATLCDGTSIRAQLTEISCQGCYLGALVPIPVGTEFRLRIFDGRMTCDLMGKTIYVHSGGGLGIFGMGVRFEEMNNGNRSVIDGWLCDLAEKRANKVLERL